MLAVFFCNDNSYVKVIVRAVAYSAAIVCGTVLAVEQESISPLANAVAADAVHAQSDIVVTSQVPLAILPDSVISSSADNKSWFDKYLPYEQRVSGWVDNTARSIDRFFGTDDAWRIDNDSWLRVTNDVTWERGEGVSHDFSPRLKLDVPTASKRLHLLIESAVPEPRTAAQDTESGLSSADERNRTTVIGIGTNFGGWFPQWKKQLQGGLRFALPIDPYARFIARRDIPLSGKWELNSYNRFSWFNSDGYSAKSELKFGEWLTPKWRQYYSTTLTWREKRDYLEFAESANLANILSPRSAVTYSLGFSGKSLEQPEITKYFLTADYRRNIARRIVFFDVIPELSLPEENDFDPHWAITLRLELYFQSKFEADR